MTSSPTTPDRPADLLRAAVARALVRYDWNAGLSGRDTPSEHHYGEADAVLAVLPAPALAVARQLLGTTSEGAAGCAMPGFVDCECDHVTGCQHPIKPMPNAGLRDRIQSAIEKYPVAAWTPENLAGRIMRVVETEVAPPAPADRAAVLREAADIAESLREFTPAYGARKSAQISENVGVLRVADHLRRLAGEAAAGAHHPTTTRSYRLEHRHLEESTWRPNTPGIGANWSWQSRQKADQRLAEARGRWPDFEHRLIETTTTVTETPAVPAAPEEAR
ncbi:hypothetical protein GTY67_13635 [Streptomyces sp. SID8374]|uniref:hypothetical protein n=1 Tax=Streptomyces sp. SID8374 TaxID=2690354 RepID=UPI001368784B|nr:hypothetical protein [Streptomyces sp. SID8374]MYX14439.1 hypothetical protein [Streptomyces sp. SID8374]